MQRQERQKRQKRQSFRFDCPSGWLASSLCARINLFDGNSLKCKRGFFILRHLHDNLIAILVTYLYCDITVINNRVVYINKTKVGCFLFTNNCLPHQCLHFTIRLVDGNKGIGRVELWRVLNENNLFKYCSNSLNKR